jgi:SAM-dependent methyltransferase
MRQTQCPVCQTPTNNFPTANSLISCPSCKVKWTYLPEEFDAEALYSDEVYAVVDNRKSIFERIIFSEAKKVLNKAKKLNPEAKRLLDFGSGKGLFLYVAESMGWDGIGVETSQDRANFAIEKYGVKVLSEYYSQGKIEGGNFDLITLNHVLEHLPDPIALLEELLKENAKGLLYTEVPRENSWQAKIAGSNWMHWDIPKHLSHWNEEALGNEIGKLGFKKGWLSFLLFPFGSFGNAAGDVI